MAEGFLKGWSRRGGVRYGGVLPAGCILSAVICLCQHVNSHTRLSELSRAQLSALSHDRQQDSEMPVTAPKQHTHTLKRRATPDATSRFEWNLHTYFIFWGEKPAEFHGIDLYFIGNIFYYFNLMCRDHNMQVLTHFLHFKWSSAYKKSSREKDIFKSLMYSKKNIMDLVHSPVELHMK